MKFVIPGSNIKIFCKAIHCFVKLGSEIYFQCDKKSLTLKTVSMSRSAYASCQFVQSFFDNIEDDDCLHDENSNLKVSTKTLLHVFRSYASIERTVNTCEIDLYLDKDCITFTFKCKHEITKIFDLYYQDCDALDAVFFKDLCPNKLSALSKLLLDVNSNFPQNLDEITLTLTTNKVVLSSFEDDVHKGKVMRTEMTLDPEEFNDFSVGVDTQVSFSLKDFRAILTFAETCSSDCQLHFESSGKPLIIAFEHQGIFSVNFVMATYAEVDNNMTQNSRSYTRENKPKNKKSLRNAVINSQSQINDSVNICNESSNKSLYHQQDILMDSVLALPSYKRVRDVLFDENNSKTKQSKHVILAPDSDDDD